MCEFIQNRQTPFPGWMS